jgi:hypothetical protein
MKSTDKIELYMLLLLKSIDTQKKSLELMQTDAGKFKEFQVVVNRDYDNANQAWNDLTEKEQTQFKSLYKQFNKKVDC